jgi:hypothetical protein
MGVRDQFKTRSTRRRISQRNILPTSVTSRLVERDFIKNTSATQEDAVTVNNGTQLNLTSTIASTVDDEIRIGVCPYMVAMFQTSLSAANHIPYGSNVDNDVYDFIAPTAVPQITTIGNDGFNVVYRASLYNGTGSNQSIIVVTQARYITGVGGSAS